MNESELLRLVRSVGAAHLVRSFQDFFDCNSCEEYTRLMEMKYAKKASGAVTCYNVMRRLKQSHMLNDALQLISKMERVEPKYRARALKMLSNSFE